jgi:hypothetical protein
MMGFKFTELGAIRFDRDLRAIIGYLSSQTAFGDAREKFLRLQQLSTVLNLDSVRIFLGHWRVTDNSCRRRMWTSFTMDLE